MDYVTGNEIKYADLSEEFLISCLPKNFKFYLEPWYHQLVSIVFGMQFTDGVGFWHSMGGGKTACAINCLRAKGIKDGILVITVRAAIKNWQKEFQLNANGEYKTLAIFGSSENKNEMLSNGADVYIVNYEGIFKRFNKLTKEQRKKLTPKDYVLDNIDKQWNAIIFDESRMIKSLSSIRTKVAMKIAFQSKFRMALSGLPIAKSIDEIYSQQYCLDFGKTFGIYSDFRREYFQVQMKKIGRYRSVREWVEKEGAREEVFERLYWRGIRFNKEECNDLPDRIYEYRNLELEGDQKRFYYDLAERTTKIVMAKRSYHEVKSILIKFMQICGGFLIAGYDEEGRDIYKFSDNIKLKELQYLLEEELQNEKVLIAASFVEEQKGILRFLKSKRISCGAIVAGMKLEEIDNVISEFEDTDMRCLVVSRRVGGRALNLTAASYQIDYSRDFDYEADRQMQDRIHRPGQKRNVTYIRLVCANTVDEKVQEVLDSNEDLVKTVLEGGNLGRFLYGKS